MSPSRRSLLGSLPVFLGIAGCAATDEPTETTTDGLPLPNGTQSPPTRTVRHPRGSAAVRTSRTPYRAADDWTPSTWLVTSSKDYHLLEFAPDADGVAEADSFLQATDFSSATVLVFQRSISHCLRRVGEEVRWDDDRVTLSWTTAQRAVECTGVSDIEALFVRIPAQITDLDFFGSYNH